MMKKHPPVTPSGHPSEKWPTRDAQFRVLCTACSTIIAGLLLIGYSNEAETPPTTPQTDQGNLHSAPEPPVGGFVLDRAAFEEQFPDPPDDRLRIQKIYRPTVPDPKQNEATFREHGYAIYESKHLTLITDLDPLLAQTLGPMLDQEYEAWVDYFGPLPEAKDSSDFRMVGYLMRNMPAIVEMGLVPTEYLGMRTGGHKQSHFWMLNQATEYYQRHLLFHEATHCFMTIMPDTRLPKWYLEGMAEMFATHRVDAEGEFSFRVIPHNKTNFAGWGRIKTIQAEMKAGRSQSINEIRAIRRIDPVNEVKNYAWSWALCYFLDTHPAYQERFRSLRDQWRSGRFVEEFDLLFADDMAHVNLEWQLFVTSVMEGYDVPRAAVIFQSDSEGTSIEIPSDRGWQNTGWKIEEGETYHITAEGRITLANDPKPWISEPAGITLQYFSGRPVGRLMGLVLNPENNQISPTIDLGRDATWKANRSGTLFLRVNDAWNSLHDNEGSYQVQFEQTSQ